MTWFKVDDRQHADIRALDVSAGAMGLWVMSGSWASAQLTDGFVPERAALRLYPEALELAAELVSVGIWEVASIGGRRGWSFVDWEATQPSAESVERDRAAARERQRRSREAAVNRRAAAASRRDSPVTDAVTHGVSNRDGHGVSNRDGHGVTAGEVTAASHRESRPPRPDPSRPDPSRPDPTGTEGGVARAGASPERGTGPSPSLGSPPPRRCEQHAGWETPPPCQGCADARLVRADYDAAAAGAPSAVLRSPPCPEHPDHPASRCPACTAEAIPPPTDLRERARRNHDQRSQHRDDEEQPGRELEHG